ncbi:MAG: hypothetical protein A2163_00665 [Actinobacteria bacterium RBG_13_35_12]|nr:MAG: hypothetical protein A2163_00665 [Actinobacteria bacterium RBG_13_35_12]
METNFNKNLIAIRKQKGLSQRDLAKLTGLSPRMIAYYEKRALNPPIDKIEILAHALEINISDLLSIPDKSDVKNEFNDLDTRTLKRLKQIINLTPQERNTIYTVLDSIIDKKNKKLKAS